MIELRRYRLEDIPQIVEIVREHLKLTAFAKVVYSDKKMTDLLTGNVRNTQFFTTVAVEDGKIIGGLGASISSYIFSYEAIAQDYFFYIAPEKRNLKLATELVAAYTDWAKERKVKRVQLSNSMGVNVKTFPKLAERLGFKQTGTIHVKEI